MGKWLLPAAVVVAILFLLVAGSGPAGTPRGGACANDADCPSNSTRLCSANGSACLETTSYRCEEPGTPESRCAVAGGGIGCTNCTRGCSGGQCVPAPANQSDLVVANITNRTNETGNESVELHLFVKNIGNGPAGRSVTRLAVGSTVAAELPTSALAPGETVILGPVLWAVSRGSAVTFIATADATGLVAESREDNNVLAVRYERR